MRLPSIAALIAAVACLPGIALAAQINVPGDHTTIQSAIDASIDGDVVIVSPGRYVENIDYKGKAILLTSLDPSDATIVANTVIDGNQAGTSVRFITNESSSSVLMGFTVTNGRGVSSWDSSAGGILCVGASPLIVDCRIVANQGNSTFAGGGLDLGVSAARIIRCCISANMSRSGRGGGMLCDRSDIAVVDCDIVGNNVTGQGSAIWVRYSSIAISGAMIQGNGSMLAENSLRFAYSTVILSSSALVGNMCRYLNIVPTDSPLRIVNTTVADNIGYGMYAGSDIVVKNCIFRGNAVYSVDGTYQRNISVGAVGPHSFDHTLISNFQESVFISQGAQLSWGPGIIDADPLFAREGQWNDSGTPDDPSDDTFIPGDYHLLPDSPCIDAGTNDVDNPDTPEVETLPDTDIAGLPRIIDGNLDGTATVDIGAYEYLPGDVNYDGKVNVLDLLLVRNSLGRDPGSSIEARKADVNADGAVNVEDMLVVRGRLAR